jgi:hypothetical protein
MIRLTLARRGNRREMVLLAKRYTHTALKARWWNHCGSPLVVYSASGSA